MAAYRPRFRCRRHDANPGGELADLATREDKALIALGAQLGLPRTALESVASAGGPLGRVVPVAGPARPDPAPQLSIGLVTVRRARCTDGYGPDVSLYALNLFDLADNDDYRAYSRRSVDAVGRHGGAVVALGKHAAHDAEVGDTDPRAALVVVEWPDRAAFDAFLADPDLADLHPLRENGTRRYIWWTFDRLDDLRPLLRR